MWTYSERNLLLEKGPVVAVVLIFPVEIEPRFVQAGGAHEFPEPGATAGATDFDSTVRHATDHIDID